MLAPNNQKETYPIQQQEQAKKSSGLTPQALFFKLYELDTGDVFEETPLSVLTPDLHPSF